MIQTRKESHLALIVGLAFASQTRQEFDKPAKTREKCEIRDVRYQYGSGGEDDVFQTLLDGMESKFGS